MRDESLNIAVLLGIALVNNVATYFYGMHEVGLLVTTLGLLIAIYWIVKRAAPNLPTRLP